MIPAGPIFHKPKSFITAKNLLYASIFLGILITVMCYLTIGFPDNLGVVGIIIKVAFFLIIFFLVKQMSFCKKWARTVWLVLFILEIIGLPFALNQLYRVSIILAALTVLYAVLHIIALIFLYNKESNIWFNNSSSEMLP